MRRDAIHRPLCRHLAGMRVPRTRRGERTDGFTLVESIVTVGLIAVVAAFVIPTVVRRAGSIDSLKLPAAAATAQTIR